MRFELHAAQYVLFALALSSVVPDAARAQSDTSFRAFAQPSDGPMDIQPSPDVDQDLFLVHGLRLIYTNWPNSDDQKKIAKDLATMRGLATTLRNAGSGRGADRELLAAYDNCLSLMDAYETYLTNIGAINRQTLQSAAQALLGALWDAGGDWAKGKWIEGKSSEDAQKGAAFTFLWEGAKTTYSVTRERQAAMEAEKQKFAAQSNTVFASANTLVQKLASEHRWQPGEASLETSRESLRDQANHRYRDPFALLALATVDEPNETAAIAVTKANYCIRAAQLVPAGDGYATFRNGFISQALGFALQAAFLERPYYAGPPSSSAPLALRLARTYLMMDPADQSGFGRVQLERALGFNGRYNEALDTAYAISKQWGSDPAFAYRYALLMSLTNSPDRAAQYLALAYNLGYNDVHDVRVTPDFEVLRRARPQLFDQLTTVKVSPSIHFYPLLPDDILIRNDSPFELTNVRFKAYISNQGPQYTADVAAKSIKPGATYTAGSATYITGNHYDSFTYSISCDQCK